MKPLKLKQRLRAIRSSRKPYLSYNRVEVSHSALLHNFDLFTKLSGQQVIPVLKSNAYGHGIEVVAGILQARHMPYIAVDSYFEAMRIRAVSQQPVLIMGAIDPRNFRHMRFDRFAFVVQDAATIRALGQTGKHIKVHLECETGMHRHGAAQEQLTELVKLIQSFSDLELEGVMSHLADSDGNDPTTVRQAVAHFDKCVEIVRTAGGQPTLTHIAQSAGSFKAQSKYANAIRLGIGLYGINPFSQQHLLHEKVQTGLRPVMRLVSTIIKITELQKGDAVSYGYTFTAPKAMRIGVLPLGYYEGLDRSLSNLGVVKIGKHFQHIAGRVCMNITMVSLDGLATAKVGDEVVVYSNDPHDPNSIGQIAAKHQLFRYSLLTGLSQDIHRTTVA